nr:MAG TPA: hypothetical protein [Caudoviricetes sp.]
MIPLIYFLLTFLLINFPQTSTTFFSITIYLLLINLLLNYNYRLTTAEYLERRLSYDI